ncbi:MAG: putative rane protein [Aeromicrobium sp.]|jgi:hypothetical protein|nr:putative rane protein [Aeromicrobium sp.]
MSCEFAHYDGAYVLGALSPAERQAFEIHLTQCDDCARSVRELAGLPGLLARVDPRVVEDPPIDVPVPPTLLPALVREVRRGRRRRVYVAVGAAAATVVIAAGATVLITGNNGSDTPVAGPTSTATTDHPMSPVGSGPLKASLGFTSVAWGTKIDLSCSYDKTDEWDAAGSTGYALVVRTSDGKEQQVATWRGIPGKTIRLTAATDSRRQDISSVEVRTADGTAVLRLAS